MHLFLIADTHVPKRARALPEPVWAEVALADVVVHAGDWVVPELLDTLDSRSARLVGMHGNNDGPELRARLPEVARVELGGLRVAVVHETGPSTHRDARMAAPYPDVDLLVFGHSHIPWDAEHRRADGSVLRLLNPGPPTDRRRQPHCTYLTAELDAGHLHDVVLHRLPPRAA